MSHECGARHYTEFEIGDTKGETKQKESSYRTNKRRHDASQDK
jgi:hypothetical protein